jgi:DNA-3-methyladenine glycosylase
MQRLGIEPSGFAFLFPGVHWVANAKIPSNGYRPVISRSYFARHVVEVARDLIGATLLVDGVGGTIVETEAYDQEDPASHSYGGPTRRNAAMFGPAGHAYVYRSYGIHWCLNFVCGETGRASAVLIRALEPKAGLATMQQRRGTSDVRRLCAGPGSLCQAMGVTDALYGRPLDQPPFALTPRRRACEVAVGKRIGITRGAGTPWRFGLAGSPYLSRRFPEAGATKLPSPR